MTMTDPDDHDGTEPTSGIEIRVGLVDYSDRNEDGEPRYWETTQRYGDFEIGRMSTREVVEDVTQMAIQKVISTWRERWSQDGDQDD